MGVFGATAAGRSLLSPIGSSEAQELGLMDHRALPSSYRRRARARWFTPGRICAAMLLLTLTIVLAGHAHTQYRQGQADAMAYRAKMAGRRPPVRAPLAPSAVAEHDPVGIAIADAAGMGKMMAGRDASPSPHEKDTGDAASPADAETKQEAMAAAAPPPSRPLAEAGREPASPRPPLTPLTTMLASPTPTPPTSEASRLGLPRTEEKREPASRDDTLTPEHALVLSHHMDPRWAPGTTSREPLLGYVGIFSTASRFLRRSLIRATYMQMHPPSIMARFVICAPNDAHTQRLVKLEQDAYRDLLVLSCRENMDDGKSLFYMRAMAFLFAEKQSLASMQPRLVMKADDDTYVHLGNLATRFATLPHAGVYFGRDYERQFMTGMGYAVSWDIVAQLGSLLGDTRSIKAVGGVAGQEDIVMARWVRHTNRLRHWISEEREFYDDPSFAGQGWAHPYTPGTLLIHRLKLDDPFVTAATHFAAAASAAEKEQRADRSALSP